VCDNATDLASGTPDTDGQYGVHATGLIFRTQETSKKIIAKAQDFGLD
jgi:hypothetical protein